MNRFALADALAALKDDRYLINATIDEIRMRIQELCGGVHTRTTHYVECSPFYRARPTPNAGPYANVSSLWYPPPHVTRRGRLNEAGESIFYCAGSPSAALVEMRPQPGDVLTVLRGSLRDANKMAHVMRAGLDGTKIPIDVEPGKPVPPIDALHPNVQLHRFFDTTLREYVPVTHEHRYKLSIALGRYLMDSDQIDGLWYRSVVASESHNVALKPASADALLKPECCWVFRVAEVVGDGGYHMNRIAISEAIEPDGTIRWTDSPPRDPSSPIPTLGNF